MALGRDGSGLLCGEAESLEIALRCRLDELPVGTGAVLPLAAGLRPGRVEAERLDAALRAAWVERAGRPATDAAGRQEFLLFHLLAGRDPHFLLQTESRSATRPRGMRHCARCAIWPVRTASACSRPMIRLRRLQLAVHALCSDGVLGRRRRGISPGDLSMRR